VTVQLGEGGKTVPQSGVARQDVVAKSVSKSKRMVATDAGSAALNDGEMVLFKGSRESDRRKR
jgi:hypothetical protein